MSLPKICVVILNWNGLKDTVECLESLQKITYPNCNVIVVDNASTGDDVSVLRARFGDRVHVIQNDRNYGFAEGNNIGIRYALKHSQPDYFVLLNNDTVVAPDFLDEMVRVAESDPQIGILGPKIYYYDYDGRNDVIWTAGGKIRWWHPWVYDGIGHNDDDLPQYQSIATVDWINGAAMMIKRRVLEEVSLLNPEYFFGNEDIEYCLRARRQGFRCVYVPASRVWHKVGRSRKGSSRSFADLPPYYRLLWRNFPLAVRAYHLLISPVLILHRSYYWLRGASAGARSQGNRLRQSI